MNRHPSSTKRGPGRIHKDGTKKFRPPRQRRRKGDRVRNMLRPR